ncbi:hypothetical protein [Micromonospora parva]|uniref:hypothetical protein n=1 Tax=Micromonospora parva TaxID=1464048 RepID=UPI00068A54D1|nr:hypothetical protein [Micromonospora parva]
MSESGQQREPDRNVDSGNPDVLLDIPKVSVDSIRLAVDGLEADLSLRARVANLLQVDAGVRVHLNGGELNVNGVNAEAQLRVRLEQLTRILGRALDTLDNNPQIIEALAHTAVDDVERSTQQVTSGAAEIKASSRHSDRLRDEPGRQVGAAGPSVDRGRPASARQVLGQPGSDQPEPGRPGSDRPASGQPGPDQPGPGRRGSDRADAGREDAGRSGVGPAGSAPDAGGPGPRAGGPGSADQGHSQGQRPAGAGQGPQRPEGLAGTAAAEGRGKPDQSAGAGPSPSGDGDGGLPGAAQAAAQSAAQSAAQLAEQAGETLRQAGRSVWEAIQGGVAQHRPQGRRD